MATIFAVGVGPGDPELVTRKAERVLRNADVILTPVSNPGDASVALEIVKEFLDETHQEIIVHQFPMTSDKSRLIPAWQEAARLIAEKALDGKNVAFITIGDPLIYSTFIYLLKIFREEYPQLPIEIIPGISSINTSAAVAGIPLVESEEKLVVIPATAGIDAISDALAAFDTVVLLKVKPLYREIITLLRQAGRESSSAFIERVGSERQRIITDLDQMEAHSPDYLSLMIIRKP